MSLLAAVAGALALFFLYGILRTIASPGTPAVLAPAATALAACTPLFWLTASRPLSDMPGLAGALGCQYLLLRAARHDPDHGAACLTYVVTIFVAQVFWCLRLAYDSTVGAWLLSAVVLIVVELAGPVVAEFRFGGTPWHPHHVAERYGLLVIITLGEVLIGTVAAISPFVNDPEQGWTTDAIALLVAGVVLIFGMWWLYFAKPWAEILHHHRERAFFWGYGHMLVFGAIVATGSGLHAVQYRVQYSGA